MIRYLKSTVRRFRDNEEGSMVVPFALWTPVFLGLIVSSIEMGTVTIRHTAMERGLDTVVRDIKLGHAPSDQAGLKQAICDQAAVLPDCMATLHLEMLVLDMRNWQDPPMQADCVDTSEVSTAQRNFSQGDAQQVTLIRACYKFKPVTPVGTLNASLPKDANGYTALVSTSAFVSEPG